MARNYLGIQIKSAIKFSDLFLPSALAFVLILLSIDNFLLFHTFAELFAITIACILFVVSWYMYPFSRNSFLMYLGCGYLWVAVLDILHTLSYEGMPIFSLSEYHTSTQFWLSARFLEATVLLTAPFFLNKKFDRHNLLFSFGAAFICTLALIIGGVFPDTYHEHDGLTDFKVYSEYGIIFVLVLAAVHLHSKSALLDSRILNLLTFSIALTICAEVFFTRYVSVHSFSNVAGHIAKIFSFWLIFIAVIRTTLQEPLTALSQNASTYDAIPDAILLVDNKGIIRRANSSAGRLVGYPSMKLIGKQAHDIFHPSVDKSACPLCHAISSGRNIAELQIKVSKLSKWLSFMHSPVRDTSQLQGTIEVIRDITVKQQSEEEYKKLNALKNSIVENLPLMLFVKDAKQLKYVEWNKAAEEMTDLSKERVLNCDDYCFLSRPEADLNSQKDHEVLDSAHLLDTPAESLFTKKGMRTVHTRKIPIYNDAGEPEYLLGISEDITERLQTERALQQSQKMDALGKLTGGIAHDYNNMLGVILGYSELLMTKLKQHPDLQEYVKQIHHAGERGADLTRKLLAFSRQKPGSAAAININSILLEQQSMLEKMLTVRIELIFNLERSLKEAWLDRGDLEDALLNIIINAMHAMNGSGTLVVSTENVEVEQTLGRTLEIREGQYVLVSISDNGCGMDQETLQSIFDPFFSTKGENGTGLGLSQVYGFVRRSSGAIQVESTLNQGTCFKLYFPQCRYEKAFECHDPDTGKKTDFRGKETILIVDDEPALRKLSEEILTAQGYHVICTENGQEALNALSSTPVDLMISDIIMPGMDGYQLINTAQKHYPNLKVQLVSGFSDKIPNQYKKQHTRIIYKPFDHLIFLERIRELLDGRP